MHNVHLGDPPQRRCLTPYGISRIFAVAKPRWADFPKRGRYDCVPVLLPADATEISKRVIDDC